MFKKNRTTRRCYSLMLIFTAACGLATLGCKEKEPQNIKQFSVSLNSSEQKHIQFTRQSTMVELKSIPGSLLSVTKVYLADHKIIVFDHNGRHIYVFDEQGNFRYEIGKVGEDTGQFKEITDMNFYPDTKTIEIFSIPERKFLKFNVEGNLISETKSSYDFLTFYKVKDGYWVYGGFPSNLSKNIFSLSKNKANLLLLSEDLKEIKEKYLESANFYDRNSGNNNFQVNSKGELFFTYGFSDIIYKLDGKSLEPYLQLNFGPHKLPYNYISTITNSKDYESEVYLKTPFYVGNKSNLQMGDQIISFDTNDFAHNFTGGYSVTAFMEQTYCKFALSGEIFDNVPLVSPVSIRNGKVIFYINPMLLKKKDFKLLKNIYAARLNPNSGPLLFIVNEKDII